MKIINFIHFVNLIHLIHVKLALYASVESWIGILLVRAYGLLFIRPCYHYNKIINFINLIHRIWFI